MFASCGERGLSALLARMHPLSLIALLTTLVQVFALQGRQILEQPRRVSDNPHQ